MNITTQAAQITIEIERNGNKYSFSVPIGITYGELYDAAFQMLQHAFELAKAKVEEAKSTQQVAPEAHQITVQTEQPAPQ